LSKKRTPALAGLLLAGQLALAGAAFAEPDAVLQSQLEQSALNCASGPLSLSGAEREMLLDFYRQQNDSRVWRGARYVRLLSQLEQLADDGLEPEDYHLSDLRRLARVAVNDPQHGVCRDLLASHELHPILAAAGGIHPGNAAAYAASGARLLVSSWPYSAPPRDVAVSLVPV